LAGTVPILGDNDRDVILTMVPHLEHCYRAPARPTFGSNIMTSQVLAHNASATATLYSGYLASIRHDPDRWEWPTSTVQYLQHRIDTIARELVQAGATEGLVA